MTVTDEDLIAAEDVLGHPLPEDHAAFLLRQDGLTDFVGDAYLDLWPLHEVVARNADQEPWNHLRERHPGIFVIGSNGGGERLAYDLRAEPPPLLLVDSLSSGWHEACRQAASLDELLQHLRRGGGLKFVSGYDE